MRTRTVQKGMYIKVSIWNEHTDPEVIKGCGGERRHNWIEMSTRSISVAMKNVRVRVKRDTSPTYFNISYTSL